MIEKNRHTLIYRCAGCTASNDGEEISVEITTTIYRNKVVCGGCEEEMEWAPRYEQDQRVWLRAFGDQPRERAKVNPQTDYPGMYSASVRAQFMADDGERELSEDQIEGPDMSGTWKDAQVQRLRAR